MSSFAVENHLSGVGALIRVPGLVRFEVRRTPARDHQGDELETGVILSGLLERSRVYLDWDLAVTGPTTYEYWADTTPNADLPTLRLTKSVEVTLTPNYLWSPVEDSLVLEAPEPRDAIIVFLSTRLAQLVRSGDLAVRNENHRKRFAVRPQFSFQEPDLPVVALSYLDGATAAGDIGWGVTHETVKLGIQVAALRREERDAVTRAIRGLAAELADFAEHAGFLNLELSGFEHGVDPEVTPTIHLATGEIALEAFTWIGELERLWELVPWTPWFALPDLDGGGAIV